MLQSVVVKINIYLILKLKILENIYIKNIAVNTEISQLHNAWFLFWSLVLIRAKTDFLFLKYGRVYKCTKFMSPGMHLVAAGRVVNRKLCGYGCARSKVQVIAPSINYQTTQIPLDLIEHVVKRLGLGNTFSPVKWNN